MVFETTTTRLVGHRFQHKIALTTIIPTPITAIGLFCTTVTVGMGTHQCRLFVGSFVRSHTSNFPISASTQHSIQKRTGEPHVL